MSDIDKGGTLRGRAGGRPFGKIGVKEGGCKDPNRYDDARDLQKGGLRSAHDSKEE